MTKIKVENTHARKVRTQLFRGRFAAAVRLNSSPKTERVFTQKENTLRGLNLQF